MQDNYHEINDEGLRLLVNIATHYDAWLQPSRQVVSEGRLTWKHSGNNDYLYSVINSKGDATSLGPRSDKTEAQFAAHQLARSTITSTWEVLRTDGAVYRALRLPRIPSYAATVLRELDIEQLLGSTVIVVGTNALAAYAIEAGVHIPSNLDTTEDFDMTWVRAAGAPPPSMAAPTIFGVLKGIDDTFTINMERPFQARNTAGEEIELLIPQLLTGTLPKYEKFQPVPLPEQDWLLRGNKLSHVVCGMNGLPARIVAPDPRWFALHKLWLADKPTRDPLKRDKDRAQGEFLMTLIAARMPRFALDSTFRAQIPAELERYTSGFDRNV